jgi:hypothetical protein
MAKRSLTPGEIALGISVYGENIDFDKVFIYDRAFLRVANTVAAPNGNIYYPKDDDRYAADLSKGTLLKRATFIHELGHVWQYQSGVDVVLNRGFNGDYSFLDKFKKGVRFQTWGIEEQAAYFEDLYLASLGPGYARSGLSLEALLTIDTGLSLGPLFSDECFLAGTMISMWDGTRKPIEQIRAGDIVVSYDKDGNRKPGRVTRTMTGDAKQILDVHGMMVTPGHATLCGDGRFAGRHVPILDILRSDGALVREDGTKIRAGTGCPLGTMGDRMIAAISGILDPDGSVQITGAGRIRAGTRLIKADGEDVSVLDLILKTGGRLTDSGMVQSGTDGPEVPFLWTFTPSLPKPEDYVLQRSGTDLHDIYQANEWEAVRPAMPIPAGGEAGATVSRHPALIAAAPVNVPLAMRNRPDAPQLSRKYRRAAEAKARKKGGLVH